MFVELHTGHFLFNKFFMRDKAESSGKPLFLARDHAPLAQQLEQFVM